MVKINSLEVENVKRVKAVAIEPAADGLTVIGGRNGQGKTSVLNAIAWALGGGRFRPSEPAREGSAVPPHLKVVLDNGLVVERKGKNSDLKVIDPEGRKSGQALLDGFVSELALDLPRFMSASSTEKAKALLGIIGVGEKLYELEQREQVLYNQRTSIGQMARQKHGAADDMPVFPDAPAKPVSATELIQRQQAILAHNGENQRKREQAAAMARDKEDVAVSLKRVNEEIQALLEKQRGLAERLQALDADLATAAKTAEQLQDESTEAIEAEIRAIDETNTKVRTNAAKAAAEREAEELDGQYADMTAQIDAIRAEKMELLKGADLPLPGLSVEGGELVYNGRRWDGMSGSEQLKVAAAIVRKLNPECGFVLVDKLEQMDPQTMAEFGAWAETEGLQVIATRVSTGDECSIIIEDGYSSKPTGASLAAGGGVSDAAQPVFNDAQPVFAPATPGAWETGRF